MSSSSEFSVKMRELRAQIASLKLEKNTLQDDRDRSETLFRAKIESLEKTIIDLRQEKDSQIQYAERAQKWLDTLQLRFEEQKATSETLQDSLRIERGKNEALRRILIQNGIREDGSLANPPPNYNVVPRQNGNAVASLNPNG